MRAVRFLTAVFLFVVLAECLDLPATAQQSTENAKQSGSHNAGTGSPSAERGVGILEKTSSTDSNKTSLVKEDWSVLQVEHVPPQYLPGDTEVLNSSDTKQFTRELVQAQWRDHDPIDLYVMIPKGTKKPPVILYLYSYASKTTNHYKNMIFGEALTQYGVAAVGFESALTGDRYHDIPQKKWFVSELQQSLGTTVHDVQLILDYLEKRGDVDMTRVGMFGDGSGATIALLAAAVDPRIKAVDLLNPWGSWPEWFTGTAMIKDVERPDYLRPEFLQKVENLDPVKWFPELKTRQVRLQYILNGISVTPRAAMERVEAAAPQNVKIAHYENTHEFLQNVALKGTGLDWLKEQLGASIPKQQMDTATSVGSPGVKHDN